jgi:hypothetical protein
MTMPLCMGTKIAPQAPDVAKNEALSPEPRAVRLPLRRISAVAHVRHLTGPISHKA